MNRRPVWGSCYLERPGQVVEFLALEAIERLVEPAFAEASNELEEKLRNMVSPEAWKLYITLSDLEGEHRFASQDALLKLIPSILRVLETHGFLSNESWEELLLAAMSEAGVSPKKREDIVALQRWEDDC